MAVGITESGSMARDWISTRAVFQPKLHEAIFNVSILGIFFSKSLRSADRSWGIPIDVLMCTCGVPMEMCS